MVPRGPAEADGRVVDGRGVVGRVLFALGDVGREDEPTEERDGKRMLELPAGR